jgi:hypothetical protein
VRCIDERTFSSCGFSAFSGLTAFRALYRSAVPAEKDAENR